MRDINTRGFIGYVVEHFWWWAFLLFVYRNVLFFPIPGIEHGMSWNILICASAAAVFVGLLLTVNRRRNDLSMFINVTLPFSLYFAVTYIKVKPMAVMISAATAAVLALSYGTAVCVNYLRDAKAGIVAVSPAKAAGKCLINMRTLCAIALCTTMFATYGLQFMGVSLLEGKSKAADVGQRQTIAANIDTVLMLQEDRWALLSIEERMQVLKVVCDIEANYLGINEVRVCADPLGEETLGSYNDKTRCVTLSYELLEQEDAHTLLEVTLHEMYHAYQYRLVDLYNSLQTHERQLLLMRDAARYKENFDNYENGYKSYYAYATQECELDSDNYAAWGVEDYYNRIEAHLAKQYPAAEEACGQ